LTVRYPEENTRNPKIQAILYQRREKNQPVSLDSYQKFRYKNLQAMGHVHQEYRGYSMNRSAQKKEKRR
jgi:hypothetical protein